MRIRIYFNSLRDAPRIWSWDRGTQQTEEHIIGFHIFGAEVTEGLDSTVPMGDKDRPRVWMEITHADRLEVINDVLHVYGQEARKQ